jgi:hypothetical protein
MCSFGTNASRRQVTATKQKPTNQEAAVIPEKFDSPRCAEDRNSQPRHRKNAENPSLLRERAGDAQLLDFIE